MSRPPSAPSTSGTGPAVLVGHSYVGFPDHGRGRRPEGHALVYVAALQPDVGEASGKLLSKFAPPNDAMRAAKNRATPDSDASSRQQNSAKPMALMSRRQTLSSWRTCSNSSRSKFPAASSISVAAWRTKPSYAILTTQDHVISPELQRWMYQRSSSKVTEVGASHAVFASQPDAGQLE